MTSRKRSTKSGVGFRFSPTDEELVDYFLMRKIHADDNDENAVIPEIKLCDYDPWELPDLIKKDSNDESWHFFSPCNYKYKGSLRLNRVTKAGFWKPTGKPRYVISKRTKKVIGTKKSLVFHKKQPKPYKSERTCFILHEYDTVAKGKSKYLVYKLNWDENIDNGKSDQMVDSPSDLASQMTVNSSCEESEIMSCIVDFGNQSYKEEIGSHLGSDFETLIPENKTGDMSPWGQLIRPESSGSEFQKQEEQDDMLGTKRVSAAEISPNVNESTDISTPAPEINNSGHNDGDELSKIPTDSQTIFYQLEALDSCYFQLCSPVDCLSYGDII